jgi:hypothetical protein
MQIAFWIFLGLVLKLPVVGMCYLIYRVANDAPEQILGDDEGGSKIVYEQGPRLRGPDNGRPPFKRGPRRGSPGHAEAAKERRPQHAPQRA